MNRPKLNIPLSKFDKLLEILAFLGLLTTWSLYFIFIQHLPETVPFHFNINGEVDSWSSKNLLIILPILASILYLGITFLNKFPHKFNYLEEITNDNAAMHYAKASKLLRIIKLIIVFVFAFILLLIILQTKNQVSALSKFIVPSIITVFLFPIIWYFFSKAKTQTPW